jgi:hypothetical protein
MDWMLADPLTEIDGLIKRLRCCRRDAQHEMQAAEQEAVVHPECLAWADQAVRARGLVRDCTAELACLYDERELLIPAQRKAHNR